VKEIKFILAKIVEDFQREEELKAQAPNGLET